MLCIKIAAPTSTLDIENIYNTNIENKNKNRDRDRENISLL
jgi:hypothetical protein